MVIWNAHSCPFISGLFIILLAVTSPRTPTMTSGSLVYIGGGKGWKRLYMCASVATLGQARPVDVYVIVGYE